MNGLYINVSQFSPAILRPGSFDSVVPVSSDPGDEGGGGDKNKNDENLKIVFNHHN